MNEFLLILPMFGFAILGLWLDSREGSKISENRQGKKIWGTEDYLNNPEKYFDGCDGESTFIDECSGTPLGRLKSIADFCIKEELCSGLEGKAPEDFLMEAYKELQSENEALYDGLSNYNNEE